MKLSQAQAQLAALFSVLIAFVAQYRGPGGERYRLRQGIGSWSYRDAEANARAKGHPKSVHLSALAHDTVLDRLRDGEWQVCEGAEAQHVLADCHTVWEWMGGARRIIGDMNHFSIEWGGVR